MTHHLPLQTPNASVWKFYYDFFQSSSVKSFTIAGACNPKFYSLPTLTIPMCVCGGARQFRVVPLLCPSQHPPSSSCHLLLSSILTASPLPSKSQAHFPTATLSKGRYLKTLLLHLLLSDYPRLMSLDESDVLGGLVRVHHSLTMLSHLAVAHLIVCLWMTTPPCTPTHTMPSMVRKAPNSRSNKNNTKDTQERDQPQCQKTSRGSGRYGDGA